MYRLIGIISILVLCTGISTIHAQSDGTTLTPDTTISVIPATPEPGEPIILEITSYTADLSLASIVWKYNGTTIASGVGKTRVSSTAPKSGASAFITASVSGGGLTTSSAAITLQTAGVDLLWEAVSSYTPPFYKGKALISPSGLVRTTAIPTASAPKNLSYEWSRNDSVDQNASGYNKNYMVFKNETLKSQESVSVSATSGSFSGGDSIVLIPKGPFLIGYQNKEGFVDYTNGYTSSFSTDAEAVTMRFEPYFFSVPGTIAKGLDFEIQNNGSAVSDSVTPNEVSLSAPETRGATVLDITIRTVAYSLQNIITSFKVLFN
jgi:hypothetical protein